MGTLSATDSASHAPQVLAVAEAIVNAVAGLAPQASGPVPRPVGVPVRSGRFNLGRLRHCLPSGGVVSVVAGFGSVCWLGTADHDSPDVGRMACGTTAAVDDRGRMVLDRGVRAWLGVSDPALFEAVLTPLPTGGLLVVPVEGFTQRFEAVAA